MLSSFLLFPCFVTSFLTRVSIVPSSKSITNTGPEAKRSPRGDREEYQLIALFFMKSWSIFVLVGSLLYAETYAFVPTIHRPLGGVHTSSSLISKAKGINQVSLPHTRSSLPQPLFLKVGLDDDEKVSLAHSHVSEG